MSFREKSAWITLVTVVLCFGAYYGAIATGAVRPRGIETFHLLIVCAAALALLQAALHAVATWLTPPAERGLSDERDALIQARSHTVGYYVLTAMVLLLGVPVHLGHPAQDIMNFALLGVVAATLAVAVSQIVMFRRGA